MRARLIAADSRINWAAVAGALCLWDIYAKHNGATSASRWIRSHPAIAIVFLAAVSNHLLPRRDES